MSLGKLIKISVLSLAYFVHNAFAGNAQTDTIKIDQVNISAYRTAMTLENAPRSISVLGADEMSKAPVISINDALKSLLKY